MPENDAEWRQLFLTELRELRSDFHEFKEEVIGDMGERRGRTHMIAAGISFLVSVLVAFIHRFATTK